jgi:Na+/melibiose symporter-like transporter
MNASVTVPQRTKFNAKIVWLIALAVFAQEISWNFYDSQIPVSLAKYITSVGVVGFVMGLDNLLGIFIQPLIGNLSDNTRTRWGRRMPFIMFGIPLAALIFTLFPFEKSLTQLMILIVLYVTVMLAFKSPVDSLMPDFIPPQHRSKGNSILKIVTSLTVILGAVISMLFVDKNLQLAFFIPAALMFIIWPILMANVKEKDAPGYQKALAEEQQGQKEAQPAEKVKLLPTFWSLFKNRDKSHLLMLVTILLAAAAWSALRALLTRYGMEQLAMSRGSAGGLTLPGGIAFLLLAYPVALLSEKFGRKLFMLIGLGLMAFGLLLGFLIQTATLLRVTVILVSVGWSAVSINGLVLVWNMSANFKTTGTFTGLFYFFYYLGQAFGPGVVGSITDLTGWYPFLLVTAGVALLALLALVFVKTGGERMRTDWE